MVPGTMILLNGSNFINQKKYTNSPVRNGDTKITPFSPFAPHTRAPDSHSVYFDGTGDYFTSSTSLFSYTTANAASQTFTIEAWVYHIQRTTPAQPYYAQSIAAKGDVYMNLGINGSGNLIFHYYSGIATTITGSSVIPLNTWTHVAVVISGGTSTLYVNGVSAGSGNWGGIAAGGQNSTSFFGTPSTNASAQAFRGYISNIRVSSNARSISVPVAPFTNDATTDFLALRGPSFTDDGPRRFAITRNGDTRITPFSPFAPHTRAPLSHSVYFDGTGDYLTLADNTAFTLTSDFTIECFFFTPVLPTSTQTIAAKWAGSAQEFIFDYGVRSGSNARTVRFFWGPHSLSVPFLTSPNDAFNVGEWVHAAIVRSGSTITMYINGVSVVSGNNGTAASNLSQPLYIGAYGAEPADYLNGYISNFRIVKGTAVYTAAFTPPTALLEATQSAGTNIAAITGTSTSLLTCQSPTVIDNSSNEFALTVYGNSQPTQFNPFGETVTTGVEYAPASHGGSMYFPGAATDGLIAPQTADFNLSLGNWTIEAWYYTPVVPTSHRYISALASNNTEIGVIVQTNFILNYFGSSNAISTTVPPVLHSWQHVALVKNGVVTTLYINGVAAGSASNVTWFNGSTRIYFGSNTGSPSYQYFYTGYVSGARVVREALYTSNFAVPTAPPSPTPSAVLLYNFAKSAAIQDKTGRHVLQTVGNVRVVNGVRKFGSGAIAFDGNGDYLTTKVTPTWANFGTSDFTIECWVYFNSVASTQMFVSSNHNAATGAGGWTFGYRADNTTLIFSCNANQQYGKTWSPSTGTWYHVAVSRSGTDLRLFVDGTQVGSTSTSSDNISGAADVWVGSNFVAPYALNGFIDDLRITKGVARYITTFTPPTSTFRLK